MAEGGHEHLVLLGWRRKRDHLRLKDTMMRETFRQLTTDRSSRRLVVALAVAVLLVPVAAWAGHQFSDVPDDNVFHDDIDWLADAGVTRGCNPPANTLFCPDDNVTREQMAAFLHRLETEDVFLTPSEGDAAYLSTTDVDGLLPIATFLVFDDGSVETTSHRAPVTASPTVERDSEGNYFVTLPGYSYSLATSRAVCTPNGFNDLTLKVRSLTGRMWVSTFDASDGTAADSGFTCAVYG